MKFSKCILALALGLTSLSSFAADWTTSGFAADWTITKKNSPGSSSFVPITQLASIFLVSTDFPRGTLSKPKKLKSIGWSTTHYPNNKGETVELCYYLPYQWNPAACMPVLPNSSQSGVTFFNSYPFDNGAEFQFRHKLTGGINPALPATGGVDTIIINYSY